MTFSRFTALLADEIMAEPEWVTPDALLVDDLGVQSIDVVQILERVEDESGRAIPSADLRGVETVADFYRALSAPAALAA